MFTVIKLLNRNVKFFKIDVRFCARAITGDRLRPLNEDTLTGRFLIYLDHNRAPKDVSTNDRVCLVRALKSRPSDIKLFDTYKVQSVLSSLTDRALVHDRFEFYRLLQLIDCECCNRLNDFGIEETFSLLGTFMNVVPNQITTKSNYFHSALKYLMSRTGQLNRDQLIHLLFFIGVLKKTANAQSMIRKIIKLFDKEFINSLTKEDLCIICNSTFKTATKINNVLLLDKIKLYINDNLYLLTDPAVFVTLIKTLRHNRYQDEDILGTITCTMFFNKTLQYYSFSALCHILALYADYLYYNEDILKAFTNKCLEQLKNSVFSSKDAYLEKQPRRKDIKRFLWALSNLNYKIAKKDIESIIMPQILVRIKAGEFKNDPGSLVQIILYLWMMQFRASDLIREFLTEEVVSLIRGKNLSPSQDSLNLLLTCIYYEDPHLFYTLKLHPQQPNNNYKHQNRQLQKRPELKKIIDNLKSVALANDIDKFEIGCQIPFINIIGITGFQKKIYKTVNIEVLDEYSCLKNTDGMPTGLMQLKLRLLEQCEEGLVVIEAPDIAECTNSELRDILEDEISLVC